MITVAYCRKSTDDKKNQVQSIPDQIKAAQEVASYHKLQIDKVITEKRSAKIPYNRPEFLDMIAQIQQGVIQTIICWKLNRLARNAIEAGMIIQYINEGKLKVVSSERTYTKEDSSLLTFVEFGMSTQYSIDLGKDVKRRLDNKANDGWLPTKPPVGWLNCPYTKHIIPDPIRFEQVKDILNLAIEKDLTFQELADYANNKGYNTNRYRPYCKQTIKKIINTPFHYGAFNWNGEIFQGKHEPMITFKEHLNLQEKYFTKTYKKKTSDYNGIFKCGQCGSTIIPEPLKKGKYKYWRCVNQRICKQKSLEQKELDRQLTKILEGIELSDDFIKWGISCVTYALADDGYKYEDQIKRTQTDIVKINTQLKALKDLLTSYENIDHSILTPAEFKEKKHELLRSKMNLEDELKHTERMYYNLLDEVESAMDFTFQLVSKFNSGDIEKRREIMFKLSKNPILLNQRVELEVVAPYDIFVNIKSQLKQNNTLLEPSNNNVVAVMQGTSEIGKQWWKVIDYFRTSLSYNPL